ncbi:type II toxin-antitoxin system PemK/MazF family toxin [Moorellaceae bacterium AZ2]
MASTAKMELMPCRGEIWLVDLNPVRGHEQAGTRPALIVSVDPFNHGPAGMVVVIPLTTRDKRIPFHIRLTPPEGGVKSVSFIKCEDVRSISKERLIQRLGRVKPETVAAVEERLRILLGL